MDLLKSISRLLTKQKLKQIDIITNTESPKTKSELLYTALRDGIISSEDEAIALLYPEGNYSKSAFEKLKYRLKDKLINTLFFIDVQSYSSIAKDSALLKVAKAYIASQILGRARISNSFEIMESVLKTCQKYELIDFQILIYRELLPNYGLFYYDRRKYKMYSEAYEEALRKLLLEDKIHHFFTILGRKITTARNLSYSLEIKEIEQDMAETYENAVQEDHNQIRFYAYNSKFFLLMYKNDLFAQSALCDEAINYFKEKKNYTNLALFSFKQKKGLCFMAFGKFNEAISLFDQCLAYNPTIGGNAWLALHNYKFSAHLLLSEYSEAYKVASKVLYTKTTKKLNSAFHQKWFMNEAFIHFLILTKKLKVEDIDVKPIRKFRLTRFLNELPEFSKDKKGANITINILQLLFYVLEKDLDKVDDKLESLKQYSFRHLKGNEYIRPKTFIRLLELIPKCDYNLHKVNNKSEKLLKVLSDNPKAYFDQRSDIEFLPFEKLWTLVIEALE